MVTTGKCHLVLKYYGYHRSIHCIHHRPCGYFPCRQRASWLQAQELCALHSDSFVLYLIINLKTVWFYIFIIIIITNWDVDVLIDIVLQDIDMHAPKCRAMYLCPLQACFAVHKSVWQYENQCMLHNIHDGEIS